MGIDTNTHSDAASTNTKYDPDKDGDVENVDLSKYGGEVGDGTPKGDFSKLSTDEVVSDPQDDAHINVGVSSGGSVFNNGDKGAIQIRHEQFLQDPSGSDSGGNHLYALGLYTEQTSKTVNGINQIYEAGEFAQEVSVRGENPLAALYIHSETDSNGDSPNAQLLRLERNGGGHHIASGDNNITSDTTISLLNKAGDTTPGVRWKSEQSGAEWVAQIDPSLADADTNDLVLSRVGSGDVELVLDGAGGLRFPSTDDVIKTDRADSYIIVDSDNDQKFARHGVYADDTASGNAGAVQVFEVERDDTTTYTAVHVNGTEVMRLNDDGSLDVNGGVNGNAF